MPPISWTSKMRWSDSRMRASRTAANASKRRSSSVSPFSSRCRNSAVFAAQLVVGERLELGLERARCRRPARRAASAAGPRRRGGPSRSRRAAGHRAQGTGSSQAASTLATSQRSPSSRPAPRRRTSAPDALAEPLERRASSRTPARRRRAASARRRVHDELDLVAVDARAARRPRSARAATAQSVAVRGAPPRRGTAASSSRSTASASGSSVVVGRLLDDERRRPASATNCDARRPSSAGASTVDDGVPLARPLEAVDPAGRRSPTPGTGRVTRRLDQAVVAVAAAVDDVHLAGLRVLEHEEVVADELELEARLLGRHRLQRELLRLHDHGSASSAAPTSRRTARASCRVVARARRFSR